MRLDEFIYFASYALSGLVLMFSSFLFMLLEHYGLQLQHLSLHSITVVAIFVHLCEMYVCMCAAVDVSVPALPRAVLFQEESSPPPLGGYYF
jgi:hypothetical protein